MDGITGTFIEYISFKIHVLGLKRWEMMDLGQSDNVLPTSPGFL